VVLALGEFVVVQIAPVAVPVVGNRLIEHSAVDLPSHYLAQVVLLAVEPSFQRKNCFALLLEQPEQVVSALVAPRFH
jgi:hypothetical protein